MRAFRHRRQNACPLALAGRLHAAGAGRVDIGNLRHGHLRVGAQPLQVFVAGRHPELLLQLAHGNDGYLQHLYIQLEADRAVVGALHVVVDARGHHLIA